MCNTLLLYYNDIIGYFFFIIDNDDVGDNGDNGDNTMSA